MKKTIVYQGEPGANSHIACDLYNKDLTAVACDTFDQVFSNVINKKNDYAMIPIENSIAGRVADIHRLMPTSGLKIIGEFFSYQMILLFLIHLTHLSIQILDQNFYFVYKLLNLHQKALLDPLNHIELILII